MGKPFCKHLWAFRQTLIIVLTPLLFLPLPIVYPGKESRCAYAICIMAVYWMTEALPIAATALLPIPLFPLLGVVGSKDLCINYLKDTNFLFVAGLLIAVAVEKWNLHKRIALYVLVLVGSKPQWLMLGFMGVTCFLSMWLSNTATAAMLMPIAHAVISEMDENRKRRRSDRLCDDNDSEEHCMDIMDQEDKKVTSGTCPDTTPERYPSKSDHYTNHRSGTNALLLPKVVIEKPKSGETMSPIDSGVYLDVWGNTGTYGDPPEISSSSVLTVQENPAAISRRQASEDKRFYDLSVGLRISIAFAANIGGTGTLTGTGPNLVFKGQVDTIFGPKTDLNFSSWFMFAFPNMVICLIVEWVIMMVIFIGPRRMFTCGNSEEKETEEAANLIIKNEYKKLGRMSFAELLVLINFTVLAFLWMFRDPAFFPGWANLPFLEASYITDACVGMTIACLLFMLPSRLPNFLCFRSKGDTSDPCPAPALLDWQTVNDKMAWSVVIVLGGSFALADACQKSGLSVALGSMFGMFTHLEPRLLALLLSFMTAGVTQITSNTATSTIFLPIVAQLAKSMGVHPFYFMIPVTVSSSLAFILPVATPPNAIVFAYGKTTIMDMVKSGFVLNIICVLILQISLNTYGNSVFDMNTYPKWATQYNETSGDIAQVLLNGTATTLGLEMLGYTANP